MTQAQLRCPRADLADQPAAAMLGGHIPGWVRRFHLAVSFLLGSAMLAQVDNRRGCLLVESLRKQCAAQRSCLRKPAETRHEACGQTVKQRVHLIPP